jgi:hypothetical protein
MPIPSIIELLVNRFHNMVAMNPNRDSAAELHNDLMMSIGRLEPPQTQAGWGGEIDGSRLICPVDKHDVAQYPSLHLSALRHYPTRGHHACSPISCLLTSEPVIATITHTGPASGVGRLPFALMGLGATEYRFINIGLGVKGAGADPVVGYEQRSASV